MAGFTERVQILIDVTTQKASSEFAKLKSAVADADGGINKMKAGFGQLTASFLASPGAIAGAATAVAGLGVKSVQAFQDTALAADKFRDATGLSIEESSRWIAVADDVGVGADTIQGAFVKMEKAIQNNRGAFGNLVATTKNGAVDLTGTFLNVIKHLQGIKDPIQRAAEASKLFGKGFAEVSDIIATDADTLKQKLAQVSDAQIIDESEVTKARNFQAAMDNLGDAAGDLGRELGETLVPVLADLANATAGVIEKFGGFKDALSGTGLDLNVFDLLKGAFKGLIEGKPPWEVWRQEVTNFSTAVGETGHRATIAAGQVAAQQATLAANRAAAADAAAAHNQFQGAMDRAAASAQRENDALNALLTAQLAQVNSALAASSAQRNYQNAAQRATTATDDASTAANEQQAAYDEATSAALQVAAANVQVASDEAKARGSTLSAAEAYKITRGTLSFLAGTASGPVKSALQGVIGKLDETAGKHPKPTISTNDQASGPIQGVKGKLDALDGSTARTSVVASANTGAAEGALNRTARDRTSTIHVNVVGGGGSARMAMAEGGVSPGGVTLVGEEGPELVDLPAGARVHPAAETSRMMRGAARSVSGSMGAAIHVHVYGNVLSERDLIDAVHQGLIAKQRRSGPLGLVS